jgi:hypothetical protein
MGNDECDDVLENQRKCLIDQIVGKDLQYFFDSSSVNAKERVAKECIHKQVCGLTEALNVEFLDVRFVSKWGYKAYSQNANGHAVVTDLYDDDYSDDVDTWSLDENPRKDYFMEADLNTMCLTLYYYWERTCSLGCKHRTKRFRVISMPTLLTLLAYYRLGKPIRAIIADYIPDFFYDPLNPPKKKKLGRPKKHQDSSYKASMSPHETSY